MNDIVTKFLKFFVGTLIFVSSVLCVFVTPGFEDTKSLYSVNSSYNFVPIFSNDKEELAVVTDYSYNNVNVIDTFVGTVTAYGPDCVGCSGVTASGYRVADNIGGVITSTTTTYYDDTFGELRILAAATNKFPFGTVIRISGGRIDGYINGIVLDRGVAMSNAWSNGKVLVDLMFSTEKSDEVHEFGRQDVTFEVLRYGN